MFVIDSEKIGNIEVIDWETFLGICYSTYCYAAWEQVDSDNVGRLVTTAAAAAFLAKWWLYAFKSCIWSDSRHSDTAASQIEFVYVVDKIVLCLFYIRQEATIYSKLQAKVIYNYFRISAAL